MRCAESKSSQLLSADVQAQYRYKRHHRSTDLSASAQRFSAEPRFTCRHKTKVGQRDRPQSAPSASASAEDERTLAEVVPSPNLRYLAAAQLSYDRLKLE